VSALTLTTEPTPNRKAHAKVSAATMRLILFIIFLPWKQDLRSFVLSGLLKQKLFYEHHRFVQLKVESPLREIVTFVLRE
jgi:hypothetical protein